MQVHLLASGSDGNATLVISGKTAILFDAGLGPRQLNQRLHAIGLDLGDIQACFLTHEHIDHIAGLKRKSFPDVPIFANQPTRLATEWQHPETRKYIWQEQPIGCACQIGAFTIESFATSHDAASSVGYRLYEDKQTLLYATDLGTPSDALCLAISEADYIVLESNHDEQMLLTGPYPYQLKQRVASKRGHLSNRQTANLLAENLTPRTRWLALAHLSRTNNLPDLALQTISDTLDKLNHLHTEFRLTVAPSLASGEVGVSSE